MRAKLLGMVAGTALMALQSANAAARTDVVVGVQIGIPAPVVVTASYPVHDHWYEPAPARYYTYHAVPRHHYQRHKVRCHERHDGGRHRKHYR